MYIGIGLFFVSILVLVYIFGAIHSWIYVLNSFINDSDFVLPPYVKWFSIVMAFGCDDVGDLILFNMMTVLLLASLSLAITFGWIIILPVCGLIGYAHYMRSQKRKEKGE